MKKMLIVLLVIGFTLGIFQLFYIRQIPNPNASEQRKMARCEAMMPECLDTLDTLNIRGFPLTSSSKYYSTFTPITPALFANVIILTVSLPALGYVAYIVRDRLIK